MDQRIVESSSTIHYTACPLCNSKDIYFVFKAQDYLVSNETFPVWQCKNCTLRFTQDVPREESIGKYYQSEAYVSHSNSNRGIINSVYQRVRKYTLQIKSQQVKTLTGKEQGALLDMGCGTGEFLHVMKEDGWETLGLEPDQKARSFAKSKHNLLVESPDKLKEISSEYFDAVTLWHVLEHIHDLHEVMVEFHRILAPEGILFIAVPNYLSKDAAIYQANWAAYDVPRHLYHFSPQAMQVLLDTHNFELLRIKSMPFDAFYVSLLSEKYIHNANRVISGSWEGFRSWMNARGRSEQSSSVLYICKRKDT
ncbi:MAG: class I SAM-dependent methyltransferase [Bacteroidota bacterium]